MSRRVPLIPTLVVLAAALLMVRLGFWQLHRLGEKQALLARYAANRALPAVPLASLWPVREDALYRRVSADCREVAGWRTEAGRDVAAEPGWRHIATCREGAGRPDLAVDLGISQSPDPPKTWRGGPVRGRLTWAPSGAPLIARLFETLPPPAPMIVSEAAAPGLRPTAQPDPAAIPNNHLSYAVQWFAFAGLAVLIYAIALGQRGRRAAA